MDRKVKKLSGGELHRAAIALGKNADLYLIDKPSAFLDAEQPVVIAKIIK
jgi:ATP-binding cassette subfamily E protein 1